VENEHVDCAIMLLRKVIVHEKTVNRDAQNLAGETALHLVGALTHEPPSID
jgi:hypothetical protein